MHYKAIWCSKKKNILVEQSNETHDCDDDESDLDDGLSSELEESQGNIKEGSFHRQEAMTQDEIKELEASVKPVQLVLVKVVWFGKQPLSPKLILSQLWKATNTIKKLSTIILPEWFIILNRMAKSSKENGKTPLASWMMPHNVATCWNSTYKMLDFTYTYCEAYDKVTANHDMKMWKYKLSKQEWKIIKDLGTVLKVSTPNLVLICYSYLYFRFSKMWHYLSRSGHHVESGSSGLVLTKWNVKAFTGCWDLKVRDRSQK